MRRTHFLMAFTVALVCSQNAAHAAYIRGSVYLQSVDSSMFRSVGSASWYNDVGMEDSRATLSGDHRVNQSSPALSYTTSVQGAGNYFYILEGPTSPSACYSTSLHVIATSTISFNSPQEGTWTGDTRCAPSPPPPPPPTNPDPGSGACIDNCDGGGTFNSSGAGSEPLLINLSGPYKLSGLNDPVAFDINAAGHSETIGWTARASDAGFLAVDRNGNGRIDDGSELFGNATSLSHGGRARNGFEALAQYDLNGDGVVDGSDSVWNRLLLWVDTNHNGVSESTELRHITDSPITSIETEYHWTGRRDQYGNRYGYEAHLREGRRVKSFYDVFFVTAR